ncbi:MAG: KilA-N domain-containing protein [Clostridia bacterium]|nr:KilA-N domain-containing protein [Clostridia bacterium]
MKNEIIETISANGTEIAVISSLHTDDFLSLTDIARYKNSTAPKDVIKNWMRVRSTIEFLGLWESINNPDFKGVEFDSFRTQAGSNAFTLSPQQWIKETNAIGIRSKSGRYGSGTFAHKDIAFEFASWISPEFKLYIIQDYQKLKASDEHMQALDWNVKRLLSKTNYRIHTDAVKENLIPPDITKKEAGFIYADEADLLNVALFGKTAKQYREETNNKKANLRDDATIEQLLVLSNLENANAILIEQGEDIHSRARKLNALARTQMRTITGLKSVEDLKKLDETNS